MSLLKIFGLVESLSDEDKETLHMLQHDKEITGAEYDQHMPSLEKAFSEYKKMSVTPLFRGLPAGRGNAAFKEMVSFRGYPSFSESFEIAKQFAHETKSMIKLVKARPGFCYYQWIESEFRNMDQESFENADGEWAIQASRDEAEWIFPFKSTFQIQSKYVEGGFTVYEVI